MSKPEQVKRFFEQNPGEWLTAEDIAAKFSCSTTSVRVCLKRAKQLGARFGRVSVYFGLGAPK